MNEQDKQEYLRKYKAAKEIGIPFFPDAIFKDAVVTLILFLILVGAAFFIGAPLEARADPADTSYTPKPEWYFLFLFQMLKYFPGKLEVIGVIVIPTIALLLLLGLPFIDRSPKRYFRSRPIVISLSAFAVIGMIGFTIVAIREAPPPAEIQVGDPTALLYTENCAPCHGSFFSVPSSVNLRQVIAQGSHDAMPAWGADLTSDEIDALTGFILSPSGSAEFFENCGACHTAPDLIASDPLALIGALAEGPNYPPHEAQEVPEWTKIFSVEERTELLNFLVAPDGQRLFSLNCSSCHGRAVAFAGDELDLRSTIRLGGLHLEMPPWREALSSVDLDQLAAYVVDPSSTASGKLLFENYCFACHGDRVPSSTNITEAREIIASGGAHETMPIWGEVLTEEQLSALIEYTLTTSRGAPVQLGQRLFSQNCTVCHGDFGEGGINPTRTDDIIAPISSSQYLKTRDDFTLRAIISQGQPNIGMSPFGVANGGPLDDDEIDAIIAFMRTWEANPPVEFPPEVAAGANAASGSEIFAEVCAQCHGQDGEGDIGPVLFGEDFKSRYNDRQLFDDISLGHKASAMIPWGEILTSDQIAQIVDAIRKLDSAYTPPDPGTISYSQDIVPIFNANCSFCHGTMGGWDASTYDNVIQSGAHGPSVIPGDIEASLLAQLVLGSSADGNLMPPGGKLLESEIQQILDWITIGAPNN